MHKATHWHTCDWSLTIIKIHMYDLWHVANTLEYNKLFMKVCMGNNMLFPRLGESKFYKKY